MRGDYAHTPARTECVPLPSNVADRLAAAAASALLGELESWPKPGLVSRVDSGSHADMNATTFEASVAAITPFFGYLAAAGAAGSSLPALRQIGLDAERAMLEATGGMNTHRGAIFGLGLMCAAAGATWQPGARAETTWDPAVLANSVRDRWGSAIDANRMPRHGHGAEAFRNYGARGARGEAASGFPTVVNSGLPALRLGRKMAPTDQQAARIHTFFTLLQAVEDTNLLHRGGAAGLHYARAAAAGFLQQGGVANARWLQSAASVHSAFIARRLSPGGCADLLAMTLFLDALAPNPVKGLPA